MGVKINNFFESVGNFFSKGEQIPWCDRETIVGLEQEVADSENVASEEQRNERLMRLSWALVHSKNPEDVHRGIAMVEAALVFFKISPLEKRKKLYLLAVGYYRSDDYAKSRKLVEQCLQIAPDWRQALTLKKNLEDKIARDGVIEIGIAATAVVLVFGGIVAAVARKK